MLYAVIVLANTLTAVHLNWSKFDVKKLLRGIAKAIVIGIGILLGSSVISFLPSILADLKIEMPYSEEITTLIIFTIIVNGIFYYSKSFIGNLRKTFKGGRENE